MNKKGFTLVEVILVIVILAILLVLLVPNVFVLIEKNKENSCNSLIKNIESSAKIYVTNSKYDLGFGCSEESKTKEISFQTLVNSGDLTPNSEGKIINPIDNTEILLSNIVKVTYNCSTREFSYEVTGIDCKKA